MKIYRVEVDVGMYQTFYRSNTNEWSLDQCIFDGRSRLADWTPPEIYIMHPKLERGNFFGFAATIGTWIVDAQGVELMDRFWSCELLPLEHKAEKFFVVNVLEVINVLDENRTQFRIGKTTGARIGIERHEFHKDRLTEAPLFKIPETCRAEVLTCEGFLEPEDEFKFNLEQSGLKGLVFHEIWNDDK